MAEETASNSSSVKTQVPTKRLANSSSGSGFMSSSFAPNEQTVISKRAPLPAPSETLPATRPAQIGKSLEGQQLGQFKLEEFVGGGGMGAVFRAIDTTLDRIVAVKVVSSDQTDEDTLRRFRNEAQSAARLDHPNIARVYSVGEEGGWNYIVFEFIEGVNVRDLVAHKGPLPLDEAISYIIQVADALEHASQRDVVHRDIKPSNLLVMQDGRSKLVDMGLARLHQVESPAEDLTATGVTLGTFDYISPEQARDPRDTDVRSDLYSLGCTFYFMLTGVPPFPEGTVLQKLLSHSSEAPPDPRDLRAGLPPEVSAIAMKLMAKLPAQRYQRPAELTAELMRLCDQLGLVTPQTQSVILPGSDSIFSRLAVHVPWFVPVCLLFAIVFGVDAVLPKSAAVSQEELMPEGVPTAVFDDPTDQVQAVDDPPVTERPEISDPPTVEQSTEPATIGQNGSSSESANMTADVSADDSTQESDVVTASDEPFVDQSAVLEIPLVSATLDVGSDTEISLAIDEPAEQGAIAAMSDSPDSTAGSEAADVATDRLFVVPEGPIASEGATVRTLEDAFKRAADDPAIRVIELQFNSYVTRPLTIDLRNDLVIEAGDGFKPLLVCDRMNAVTQAPNQMLRLLGGSLSVRGVHFRFRLPYSADEDWALLHLNQVKELALERCSFTVENAYSVPAAFIHVQSPRLPEMPLPGAEPTQPPKPNVILDSCIARGAATFVRATEGLPFALEINNGLVATTERFVELGQRASAIRHEIASVKLREVTIESRLGLCRASLVSSAAKLPVLLVDAEYCLFDHNNRSPLIEHVGINDLEQTQEYSFKLKGQFNRFPQTEIVWRLDPREGEPIEIDWDTRTEHAWYEDTLSEGVAQWMDETRDEDRSMHEVVATDYLIAGDDGIGFQIDLLPEVPKEPTPESD